MELNSIQEIIDDISQGKMVILMDDEDRENEGDLVLAAEMVDAEAINFMATHARGLICLAINEERCKTLGLEQMVKNNGTELGTAFTTSIEAAEGVTTGISAADRATTIKAAVNLQARAEDIVQPGHVFPIKAQEGGVLTRAGHTEAGTDLAKLAGFDPSAVIVEIMNDDGTMARRKDLEIFAKKHSGVGEPGVMDGKAIAIGRMVLCLLQDNQWIYHDLRRWSEESQEDFEHERLPTLDFEMWLDSKMKIGHSYYQKPTKTPYVLMERSAMSYHQKFQILSNEMCRRLSSK